MAAHCADAHAQAVDRGGRRTESSAATQDLVGFDFGLPLFLRHPVAQVLVDPGNQVAAQRHAEVFVGQRGIFLLGQHATVDRQNGRRGVIQQRLDRLVDLAELGQQFAHVLRAAAGSGLVRHGSHPFHQVVVEQAGQAHQHAADRAVAADEVAHTALERRVDDRAVDRVQHDDGVIRHAQGAGRIDPDAVPARAAQLRVDLGRVVAALRRQNDRQFFQSVNVVGILQGARAFGPRGRGAASIAGGKEHRFDQCEVVLVAHALHEHRADHSAPADKAYCLIHFNRSIKVETRSR
ncbi:hypothetical protein D3C73_919750 [compost metagenome]